MNHYNSPMSYTKNKTQYYEEMLFRHIANSYVAHKNEQIQKDIQKIEDESKVDINIARLYKRQTKKELSNDNRFIWVYKAGSAVAVLLITIIVLTMTVPTVRAAAIDFFFKIEDTHTDLSAYEEGEVISYESEKKDRYSLELDKEYEITYLPDGFFIVTENKSAGDIIKEYYDSTENYIVFMQLIDESAISVDTEAAEVSSVNINGVDALISVKESNNTINIVWKIDNYFIRLSSIGVEKDELIKVAKSIR